MHHGVSIVKWPEAKRHTPVWRRHAWSGRGRPQSHGPLVLPPPLLLSHEPALPSHHPSLPPLLFIHLCPSLLLVMASWDAASELGAALRHWTHGTSTRPFAWAALTASIGLPQLYVEGGGEDSLDLPLTPDGVAVLRQAAATAATAASDGAGVAAASEGGSAAYVPPSMLALADAEGVPDWTRSVGALVNGPVRDGLGFGRSTVLGVRPAGLQIWTPGEGDVEAQGGVMVSPIPTGKTAEGVIGWLWLHLPVAGAEGGAMTARYDHKVVPLGGGGISGDGGDFGGGRGDVSGGAAAAPPVDSCFGSACFVDTTVDISAVTSGAAVCLVYGILYVSGGLAPPTAQDVVGRVVADWTASRGVFRRMLFLRLSTDAPLRGGVPSESSLGAADSSLVDLLRVLTTGDGRPALALRLGCVSMTGSSEGAVSVIPKLTSWVPLDVVADNLPPFLLEASDAVDAGNGKIANALQGTRLVVLVLWPQVQTMELASRIGLSACLAVVRSRYETLRHFGSASQDVDEGTPAIRWTRAEQVMWLVMLFDAARRRPLVVDKRRRQLYGSQLVSLLLFTVEMGTPLQVREALQLVRRWVGVGRPKRNPLEMGGAECAEDGSFWTTKLVDVLLLALSRQGWDALSGEVLGLVSAAEFADVPSCVALVDGLQVCAAGSSTEDARDGWIAAHTAVSHVLAGVVARCPSDWEHPPSVVLAVEAAARFAFGVPAVHFLLDSFVSLAKQQSISCITRILASAAGGGDAASDPSVDVAAPVAARTFCGGSPPEALLLLCRHAIRCGVSGQDGGVGGEATASLGASLLRIGHQPTMELFLVKVVSHCSDSTLLDLLGDPGFFAAGALTGAMRTVLSRTVHRRLQRTDLTKPVLTWSMHPPEKWGRRRTALAVALAEFFEDGEETRLEMTGFSSSVQAQTMLQRATAGQTYDAGAGWSASFEVSSRSAATQLTVLKTRCVHEGRLAAWRIRKKVADILTSLLASPPTPVAVGEAGGGPAETPVGTPAGAPVDQLASPVPTASDGDDSSDASATVPGLSVRTGESGGFASSSRWTPTPSEGTVFGTPSPKRQRT